MEHARVHTTESPRNGPRRLRRPRVAPSCLLALALWMLCAAHAAFAFTTVVIDPGHGGIDRGGIPGQRVPEKVMALDTALRLNALLRAAGFRTILTRHDDTFISLPERVAIANAQRDAIFISIHYNAAPRAGAEGFETYYYSRRSAKLAIACYNKIIQAWPGMRRGVMVRGFFVIRKTNIPAILVEPGFLTNPGDAALISRASMRQRIASLLAAAIISKRGM
jgi:N-acetylmuramoyl-L-alanine amidase